MSTNHATWGMSYSATFRDLAEAAAARAVADLDNPSLGKHRGRDGALLTHTPHAAEAVILSVTALEAGINEMAAWLRLGFGSTMQPLPDNFQRTRISEKWSIIPRSVAGVEFDRGTQPWQDFSTLIGLRDSLVHFKWHDAQVPNFMRSLQTRDLTIPDEPGIYWVDAALTDRVAIWATTTTDCMFAGLAQLLGRSDPMTWPWQ